MTNTITDSQDEQCIEELYRDADQVQIPIFQREYVWSQKQFEDLIHDVELIHESIEETQFLGAIVAYERPRIPGVFGRLKVLDIVDGQQRLLTLYIFVLAIAEKMFNYDEEAAAEIIKQYSLLPERKGLNINTRIVPSFGDRTQFRAIWDRLNSPELMREILSSNPPKPPLPSGETNGKLRKQYDRIYKWLNNTTPSTPKDAIEYLTEILSIITQNLTFVHLKLTDASVATKIFERLNFRGVKVGIFDLVRNEVFSRTSDDAEKSMEIFQTSWKPFEAKFEGKEESFFFPYCLIHNNNIKKSEIFSELRLIWKDFEPIQIIEHMIPYQIPFVALNGNPNYDMKEINDALKRLRHLRAPSSINPFIMKILFEMDEGKLEDRIVLEMIEFVENFLVRRAIVGYEPTGLHAVFKGIFDDLGSNPTKAKLKQEILKKPTIQYPNDKEIEDAIKTRPLAKTRICNYLLREYDRYLPGDNPSDNVTIEHILPETWDDESEWAKIFTKQQHKKYKDTIANLIPLSSPLNSSIQAARYEVKRKRYQKESMFVTPRLFAETYDKWNLENLNKRTEVLFDWIIKRWQE